MNVLYTCDNNYVWLMSISMISLFENNKMEKEITVYLIGDTILEENKRKLEEIAKTYKRNCIIIDVTDFNIPNNLCSSRWPKSAYIRLFASKLLPETVNKILYLDCDTVILGNIDDLWNIDIQQFMVCGVKDCIGKLYKKNIGIPDEYTYINAGVLLLNLELMRKCNVTDKINVFLSQYGKYIHYADQDVLNGVFYKDICSLNPQYNVMTLLRVYSYDEILKLRHPNNYYSKSEVKIAVEEPIIVHYTTNMRIVRPWFKNSNHPYKEEFLKYFSISPWKTKTMDKYEFSTKETKLIGIIQKLPTAISFSVLGMIHSKILPVIIRLKGKMKKG